MRRVEGMTSTKSAGRPAVMPATHEFAAVTRKTHENFASCPCLRVPSCGSDRETSQVPWAPHELSRFRPRRSDGHILALLKKTTRKAKGGVVVRAQIGDQGEHHGATSIVAGRFPAGRLAKKRLQLEKMFLVGVIAQDGERRSYGRHEHDVDDPSGHCRMEVLCQSMGRKNWGERRDQQILEDIHTVAVLAEKTEEGRLKDPAKHVLRA